MSEALKFDLKTVRGIPDPTTESGEIFVYNPETTGPEGGAWWVVSYGDPIPIEVDQAADEASVNAADPVLEPGRLSRFARPYDWNKIDHAVRTTGGAIVEGLLSREELDPLDHQIDAYLKTHAEAAAPASGSQIYDLFLGHKTLRFHGLLEKIPSSAVNPTVRPPLNPLMSKNNKGSGAVREAIEAAAAPDDMPITPLGMRLDTEALGKDSSDLSAS